MTALAPEPTMTMAPAAAVQPGVYDIPEREYHADPLRGYVPGGSLSSSGARKILHCPATFKWEKDNPPAPKKTLEIGSAAHKLVLGTGPKLVRIDADEWRTKAIKEEVAAVREAGGIPLKPAEWDQVHAMADAIRRHPVAGPLFSPERGAAEQTLLWQDPRTGVWRRALIDHLPYDNGRRMVLADYKTCESAALASVRKSIFNYGYHCQDAWYRDGVEAIGLDPDPAMVFVFQEKTAPYLINIVQLDRDSLRIGRERNAQAIDIFRDCTATGIWPGYGDGISWISPPLWAANIEENM